MKAIWDACKNAGVPIPYVVEVFFEREDPDPNGVEVELPLHKWKDDKFGSSEGFEIHVSEIPKDVTIIRFYNAW